MRINDCDHACLACTEAYTHVGICERPFHDICNPCAKDGWQLMECGKCNEWAPIKDGFLCEQCRHRKVRVA